MCKLYKCNVLISVKMKVLQHIPAQPHDWSKRGFWCSFPILQTYNNQKTKSRSDKVEVQVMQQENQKPRLELTYGWDGICCITFIWTDVNVLQLISLHLTFDRSRFSFLIIVELYYATRTPQTASRLDIWLRRNMLHYIYILTYINALHLNS